GCRSETRQLHRWRLRRDEFLELRRQTREQLRRDRRAVRAELAVDDGRPAADTAAGIAVVEGELAGAVEKPQAVGRFHEDEPRRGGGGEWDRVAVSTAAAPSGA